MKNSKTTLEDFGLEKLSPTSKLVRSHCAANDIKTCHWVNIDMKIAEIAANNNGDPEEGMAVLDAHSKVSKTPRGLIESSYVSQGFSLSRPKKSM
jgi:hypothetical protein